MTAKQRAFLDEMSDEQLLVWLNINYRKEQPVWKRCSKKEYEKKIMALFNIRNTRIGHL